MATCLCTRLLDHVFIIILKILAGAQTIFSVLHEIHMQLLIIVFSPLSHFAQADSQQPSFTRHSLHCTLQRSASSFSWIDANITQRLHFVKTGRIPTHRFTTHPVFRNFQMSSLLSFQSHFSHLFPPSFTHRFT